MNRQDRQDLNPGNKIISQKDEEKLDQRIKFRRQLNGNVGGIMK